MEKNRNVFREDVFRYIMLIAVLLVVALVSSKNFFRIDLTSEKRYTLSESTKSVLRNLDSPVYFRIYLAGDLPPDFVKFQVSIRELLEEFRAYGRENIQYDFINIYDEKDEAVRNRTVMNLYNKGLR